MSLWGIFKSPLFFGGNMPENDEWTLSLLTNREYLKMHREATKAHQHYRSEKNGKGTVIWVANGKKCKYAALFNTKDTKSKIKFNLSEILMPDEKYKIYDIWAGKELGEYKNTFTAEVEAHGAVLIKIY